MKVFISWSGKLSKEVAKLLQVWLKESVFQDESIETFISSEDIDAGTDWLNDIKKNLLAADCAIIVLTKDNISAPWLNFESGSIAVSKDEKKAIPFLVNISTSELQTPLKHFQAVTVEKDSIKKLIVNLKEFGGYNSPSHIDDSLPRLHKEISEGIETKESEILSDYIYDETIIFPKNVKGVKKGKVFVGVPMASADDNEYSEYKDCADKVKKALLEFTNASEVYCPCEEIPDRGKFDGYKKAILKDFQILRESEHYIFIYPKPINSSILVEMGYAIALSKNTTIFAKNTSDLPFMLEEADKVIYNLEIHKYDSTSDIVDIIKRENDAFLIRES